MSIVNFTTFEEVRAALGVSTTELTDLRLGLPMHAIELKLAMDDLHEGIAPLYAQIVGIPPIDRSVQQSKFYEVVRLFSTYAVASSLTKSLPLFSVKQISDGRADYERNADYYKTIRDDIAASVIALGYRVKMQYGALVDPAITFPARGSRTLLVLSPLGTDPVTNA